MTVNTHTGEIVEPLSQPEAERLTQRIALKLDAMADTYAGVMPLIREAIERQAYRALGYASVGAYISERFGDSLAKLGMDMRRVVVHELTEAGMSSRAIAPVVGVSDRQIRRDMQQVGHVSHLPQTPAATAGAAPAQPESPKVAPAEPADTAAAAVGSDDATATTPGGETPATTRPSVVGLDGKTYQRPAPKPSVPKVDEAEWDAQDRAEELASNLARNISLLYAVTDAERRAEYIANWRRGTQDRPALGSQFVTPKHMRDLSAALLTFADEWENADV